MHIKPYNDLLQIINTYTAQWFDDFIVKVNIVVLFKGTILRCKLLLRDFSKVLTSRKLHKTCVGWDNFEYLFIFNSSFIYYECIHIYFLITILTRDLCGWVGLLCLYGSEFLWCVNHHRINAEYIARANDERRGCCRCRRHRCVAQCKWYQIWQVLLRKIKNI